MTRGSVQAFGFETRTLYRVRGYVGIVRLEGNLRVEEEEEGLITVFERRMKCIVCFTGSANGMKVKCFILFLSLYQLEDLNAWGCWRGVI